MKAEKLRESSVEELENRERDLREQIFRLRLQKATGQLDKATKLKETKRDLARVLTVRREKSR